MAVRPRTRVAGAAIVSTLAIGGVVVAASGADDPDAAPGAASTTATATVERRDLVESETVDGELGHSDARAVVARAEGTVTWTPRPGTVVDTSGRLFEVDGDPVFLLDGSVPAYRDLAPGTSGDDVRQLERNLRELGLDPDRDMRVDGEWDAGTTAAVVGWQRRKALPRTGTIELGRVVFQPGRRRVGAVAIPAGGILAGAAGGGAGAAAGAGSSAGSGTTVMTTTSTRRIVAVDLETADRDLVEEGGAVTVEMPDGTDAPATVVRVARVAVRRESATDEDPPATVKVTIRLREAVDVSVDEAPVDVRLESRRVRDVLTVPVTALLARSGGTFAVEVREGDRRRVVPVEPGLFTDGDVEIEGAGLREGMEVSDARV